MTMLQRRGFAFFPFYGICQNVFFFASRDQKNKECDVKLETAKIDSIVSAIEILKKTIVVTKG